MKITFLKDLAKSMSQFSELQNRFGSASDYIIY